MSLTEKTDIRDSDEKVVEFLPDCKRPFQVLCKLQKLI